MKKFAVLVLGFTLLCAIHGYSMDKDLEDTEKRNHGVSITQQPINNQSFHNKTGKENSSVTIRFGEQVFKNDEEFQQWYWEQVERNVKEVGLGCGIGFCCFCVVPRLMGL